jgi:hypothetical protein
MTTGYDDALSAILSKTPVHSADEVLAVLESIVDTLPPGDGIWCFAKLYRAVTLQVGEALGHTTFHDPLWMDRLDAVFGNLFFRATQLHLSGSDETPRAWYPLFAARHEPRAALQFAFAGINAHINRDLPVALVLTCQEAGVELSRVTPEYQDYLAINPLLADVQARVKEEFVTGPLAVADHLLGKVDDLIANFSIAEARSGAWSHGETLWALRANAAVSSMLLDTLDGLVGFASRGLLVSL